MTHGRRGPARGPERPGGEDRLSDELLNILASSEIPILLLDRRARVRRFTPPAVTAFGLGPSDVGRPFADLKLDIGAPHIKETVRAVVAGAPPKRLNVRDGGERWSSVWVRPYKTADGRVDGAVLSLTDVEALRENEGRQREFVANVSHELMTPITAIKGYAESLVAGVLEVPGKRLEFTQIIGRNADRLAQLVEDLLQLSSHEAGRAGPETETVALRAAAERTARAVAPAALARRVAIRVQIPRDFKVVMNRAELSRVLQNLCENAIKYNRTGGRVYLRAERVGKRIVVSVQDTGIGVPKEDLARVFDRFHRAGNAKLRTARGNGLGLSIARAILLKRGCRIWAESVENEGATFSFTLPRSAGGDR